MVIFGFGPGKQEDLGEVAPCVCPNCHNQVFLHHVQSKKKVSLYFVPVVPYGTDDYLVCPVCSRGLQLGAPQLAHVRSMTGATAAFRTGRLAQAPYMAQAERFWRQLGVNPAGQQIINPASPGPAAPAPPPPATRPVPGAGSASPPPPAAPRPPLATWPAPPPVPAPPHPATRPAPPPAAAQPPSTPAQPPSSPAPPPAADDDQTSWIAQLRKLAELHDQGVLSDAAYEAAKRRVLDQK